MMTNDYPLAVQDTIIGSETHPSVGWLVPYSIVRL